MNANLIPSFDSIIDAHAADLDARVTAGNPNLIARVVARLRARGATVDAVTESERDPILAVCSGGRNGYNFAETVDVTVDFTIGDVFGAVVIRQVHRKSQEPFRPMVDRWSQSVREVVPMQGSTNSEAEIKAAIGWAA